MLEEIILFKSKNFQSSSFLLGKPKLINLSKFFFLKSIFFFDNYTLSKIVGLYQARFCSCSYEWKNSKVGMYGASRRT